MKIFIYEDNGDGLTLQTTNFCHYYDNPLQLAFDYAVLQATGSTENWEGNEPEMRFDINDTSCGGKVWSANEVKTALETTQNSKAMRAMSEFLEELKRIKESAF